MRRALLFAVLVTTVSCDARPQRFPLGFERMRDQPRYDPYQRSGFFADGKTMRSLPDGTVAADAPTNGGPVATGHLEGRPITEIPVPVTTVLMARGQNRYDVFCAVCHALNGAGDSPVARNMQLRPPPSLLDDRIRALPVGRVYGAITLGYGLMPSYARQLSIDERWGVVAYVRALELRDRVPIADLTPPVRAEAEQSLRGGDGRGR